MASTPPSSSEDIQARLASRLKMRHLQLPGLIAQHGSLTRVAEHMATSQPAVTHALAELEAMFGAPLHALGAPHEADALFAQALREVCGAA